ncbi:hypothetical protein [Leyella stercorea]|nr:hypothetical protein [Leyella stercorea]
MNILECVGKGQSIRVGRRRCLRRSTRMSVTVDADVCNGRCGWFKL